MRTFIGLENVQDFRGPRSFRNGDRRQNRQMNNKVNGISNQF